MTREFLRLRARKSVNLDGFLRSALDFDLAESYGFAAPHHLETLT
jgi:hypothetical protein